MSWRVAVFVVLGATVTQAFIFSVDHSVWNDLKLTWGINPLTHFNSQPRTQRAAQAAGWVELVSGATCASNHHFKGNRYVKANDMAAILIYDVNGYIAGLQAGFPQNHPNNTNHYPSSHITPPLVLDGGNYFVTAYFVDPATICSPGRTAAQYHSQGTGSGLWIQNGTNPVADSIRMPHRQTDVERNPNWTKGKCFNTMGMHYWYKQSASMSCDTLYPVFLMYNGGVLNAFGWAFGINLESSIFEHVVASEISNTMRNVPTCMANLGTMSSMHIYLDNHYILDRC